MWERNGERGRKREDVREWREGGKERWSWRGREGGKKKDIESEKWRERGSDKGEMERECVCLGVR